MKLAIIAAMLFAMTGYAGDLNVAGNLNVTSNLTANEVTLGGESRTNWPSGTPTILYDMYGNPVINTAEGFPQWGTWIIPYYDGTNLMDPSTGNPIVLSSSNTTQTVENETPVWVGSTELTLAHSPGTSLRLYKNGLRLASGDYTVTATNITLSASSSTTDVFVADYRFTNSGGAGGGTNGSLIFAAGTSWAHAPYNTAWYGTNWTAEAWVKTTAGQFMVINTVYNNSGTTGGWAMDSYSYENEAYTTSSGDYRVVAGGTFVGNGEWHHMAFTYASGTGKLYINGGLVNTQSSMQAPVPDTGGMLMLARRMMMGSDTDVWGDVQLAEVRFSNGVRYSGGFTPSTTLGTDADTVAYWPFTEGSGSTASDASGNNHSLTLEGSPTWSSDHP
jgi:hypothetical protein